MAKGKGISVVRNKKRLEKQNKNVRHCKCGFRLLDHQKICNWCQAEKIKKREG